MRIDSSALRQRLRQNAAVRSVGAPTRNAVRWLGARIADRLGDPTMRLGRAVGQHHPELVSDPGLAVALVDGAERMYRNGVFDVTQTVDDWAVFVRHSPPGHFYSPVPSYGGVLARADRIFDTFPDALPGFDLNEKVQEATFHELSGILEDERLPLEPEAAWRYCGANGYYGIADALILHAMLRWLRPRRVIEVGSGWSSALILDTVDRYLSGDERLTFIEPYPERLLELLRPADHERTTIHAEPVQNVDPSVFAQLGASDLLFIDSSHVVTVGGDVPFLINDLLPTLPSGVVVHVHDIFWPFEILRPWFEEGRLWAEPYVWRAFLTNNSEWEVLFFNHWFVNARRSLVRTELPRFLTGGTGSLWLRRR